MKSNKVLIVLGSSADEKYLARGVELLKKFQVPYLVKVASAHRSPERVEAVLKEYGSSAQIILAFAGHAAHLAGVIASKMTVPVVAVPLPSSDLQGMDSLLSSVQMPGGVPVACMGIGDAGSHNAAGFAIQVLALQDPALADRWRAYKNELAEKVATSSVEVEKKWNS